MLNLGIQIRVQAKPAMFGFLILAYRLSASSKSSAHAKVKLRQGEIGLDVFQTAEYVLPQRFNFKPFVSNSKTP